MANAPDARPVIHVQAAPGGWPQPWSSVAEIADVLPCSQWTLVGGLMTQLHTVHRGIGVVRATNDVDLVLHIETSRGVPERAARALESLGYSLLVRVDPRDNTAHRWARDGRVVDVLTADHAAPSVVERLRGRDLVPIPGGTQALRRTVNAVMEIAPGHPTTVSVPRPFGAVVLKAPAYQADSRDRDRHLYDAAALLACIEDPFVEAEGLAGSDRRRIRTLIGHLPSDHPAWRTLDGTSRNNARAALRILSNA